LLDDFRTPVTAVLVEGRRRIKKRKQGRVFWKTRIFHYGGIQDQVPTFPWFLSVQ
jgi:hypothetical protein